MGSGPTAVPVVRECRALHESFRVGQDGYGALLRLR